MGKRCTRDIGAEIITALMWGPKTQAELTEYAGLQHSSTRMWLRDLRAAGAIYVHSFRKPARGQLARVFAIQAKPFEIPDAQITRG
jgi:hypothetical protein